MRKTRKELPPVARIALRADVEALCRELRTLDLLNTDLYNDFNYSEDSPIRDLLSRNLNVRKFAMSESEARASRVPAEYRSKGYRQLSLTEPILKSTNQPEKEKGSEKEFEQVSALQRIRRLKRDSPHYDPKADERNYGRIKDSIGPVVRQTVSQLGGVLCRVRLASLAPDSEIQPHRDYDPTYLVRYHIPLITDQDCLLFVRHQSMVQKFHLPADGSIYFLNAGLVHWVKNAGTKMRIHLLIDVDGQDCLTGLEPVGSIV